ncbi:MAG: hypothetical protein IT324_31390 [Anaerolineae bacterium]|nr:hypothetical protein [Anaerolineae bacterium]
MLRRLYAQLPDFAQPTHPFMRYTLLRQNRRTSRRLQIIRAIVILIVMAGLVATGWQIATNLGRSPIDVSAPLGQVFLVLYWPLVFVQLLMRLSALGSTSGVIASEMENGTWDTLKITTNGAILTMKTRWAAVFYRLSILLGIVTAVRIVFIIGALLDLMRFQGDHIYLLLSGTTPFGQFPKDMTIFIGIIVMAMMMTASLLAPFTAVAFDAGLGMLLGTMARGRLSGTLGQVSLMLVRVFITFVVMGLGAAAIMGLLPFVSFGDNSVTPLASAFLGIAEGDLGLSMLHLPYVLRLWADHEYGVLVGIAVLGYVLLQAWLANYLIKWAGRRAAKADNL